jgi:hypothetical protein
MRTGIVEEAVSSTVTIEVADGRMIIQPDDTAKPGTIRWVLVHPDGDRTVVDSKRQITSRWTEALRVHGLAGGLVRQCFESVRVEWVPTPDRWAAVHDAIGAKPRSRNDPLISLLAPYAADAVREVRTEGLRLSFLAALGVPAKGPCFIGAGEGHSFRYRVLDVPDDAIGKRWTALGGASIEFPKVRALVGDIALVEIPQIGEPEAEIILPRNHVPRLFSGENLRDSYKWHSSDNEVLVRPLAIVPMDELAVIVRGHGYPVVGPNEADAQLSDGGAGVPRATIEADDIIAYTPLHAILAPGLRLRLPTGEAVPITEPLLATEGVELSILFERLAVDRRLAVALESAATRLREHVVSRLTSEGLEAPAPRGTSRRRRTAPLRARSLLATALLPVTAAQVNELVMREDALLEYVVELPEALAPVYWLDSIWATVEEHTERVVIDAATFRRGLIQALTLHRDDDPSNGHAEVLRRLDALADHIDHEMTACVALLEGLRCPAATIATLDAPVRRAITVLRSARRTRLRGRGALGRMVVDALEAVPLDAFSAPLEAEPATSD